MKAEFNFMSGKMSSLFCQLLTTKLNGSESESKGHEEGNVTNSVSCTSDYAERLQVIERSKYRSCYDIFVNFQRGYKTEDNQKRLRYRLIEHRQGSQ